MNAHRSVSAVAVLLWGGLLAHQAQAAMELDVGLARPVLLAGRRNVAHLRVSLIGGAVAEVSQRPAVNVCLAIDRSGSMEGEKIAQARAAAVTALGRLGPRDTVSVVAYDDVVQVIVPAMPASERRSIEAGIRALEPGGRTALFAGVVKCAGELRKSLDRRRVNRIVLLSDGAANVGPSTPAELGALGAELMEQGISVTTVGLGTGYNEALMSELAMRSDGGHLFVERAEDLGRLLDDELEAATNVVARDVDVRVRCPSGVRPVRVLGRPADVVGNTVIAPFAKVYARRQHYFVVELEVDPGAAGSARQLAEVEVTFRDLLRDVADRHTRVATAHFTGRSAEVESRANPAIIAELRLIDDNLADQQALALLKRGDAPAARAILEKSAASLEETFRATRDARLRGRIARAREKARKVEHDPPLPNILRLQQEMSDDPLNGLRIDGKSQL